MSTGVPSRPTRQRRPSLDDHRRSREGTPSQQIHRSQAFLADDSQLTERARASITGEVIRRQELLKAAGSSPSISHYRELRRSRPELPPLPNLLIVIDEFGELLTADPDFVDLLAVRRHVRCHAQ